MEEEKWGDKLELNKKQAIWSKDTPPIKKLDDVLRFLDRDDVMDSTYIILISNFYGNFRHQDDQTDEDRRVMKEMNAISAKLFKDGYILKLPVTRKLKINFGGREVEMEAEFFFMSFEGSLFIRDGGYKHKITNEKIKMQSLILENESRKANEQYLLVGSWLAGLGTSGVFLVEVLKICYNHWELLQYLFTVIGLFIKR